MSNSSVEQDVKKLTENAGYWTSEVISCVFNINQPRDIVQGATKGAGNIIMGTFLGGALMLSSPIICAELGFEKGGAKGALKGSHS